MSNGAATVKNLTGMEGVINGFFLQGVGFKVAVAYPSDTTETYTYKNGSATLGVITVTYVDDTKEEISSVERTA